MPATVDDRPTDEWVTRWLSEPRLAVYLTTAQGDRACALELYEWNARLSAGFAHDLAHLEVGLRNAYDRVLATHLTLPRHWTACGNQVFAPVMRTRRRGRHGKVSVDINAKPRAALDRAIREAGGPNALPGKVIAQLTFGFWRYLTSAAHETTLWRPALHHAFPPGTARPEVDTRIGRLHALRNRVAHHEPLLALNTSSLHHDLLHVAALLDNQLGDHISASSAVPTLLTQRPRR
ncbi:hypothetical protein GOARA_043_00360 [Gordonia araii NBRC 100433]|uniref:Abi-like protein n=1 Tax=Gordonia araii NBRC 100433 TaxID=1073574 RepID=G7H1A1_9ACTN|nr:hypothetical protein [Gordonia araii]NNG96751.1 hypothetical protein [Gordonia araii NBRC 100433]GAB09561.1 hypothetical protein GOARA_043_00360 [Gordonia araii NBRC 100433]